MKILLPHLFSPRDRLSAKCPFVAATGNPKNLTSDFDISSGFERAHANYVIRPWHSLEVR